MNFKIEGNIISGSNIVKDDNFKKEYVGTYNSETNEVEVFVTYSFGQIATYKGKLGKNGEETKLRFEITKPSKAKGEALVGDWGYVSGE